MLVKLFGKFAREESDDFFKRLMKALTFGVSLACCICGVLWFLLYWKIFDLGLTTFLPLSFAILVGTAGVIAHIKKKDKILAGAQVFCITWIPALIQWSIGSVDQSGLVIAWSFVGPVSAMIFFNKTSALGFMVMWIFILLVSTIFEPNLGGIRHDLPRTVRSLFYIMNLGASSGVIYLALEFGIEKDRKFRVEPHED